MPVPFSQRASRRRFPAFEGGADSSRLLVDDTLAEGYRFTIPAQYACVWRKMRPMVRRMILMSKESDQFSM